MPELPLNELRSAFRSLPLFNEANPGDNFRSHLRLIKIFFVMAGLDVDSQKKLALIYSIRGRSANRVNSLQPGSTEYNNAQSYQEFEDKVKNIFMPHSEQALARTEFAARRQGVGEDIQSYFSDKLALFEEAYPSGPENFQIFLTCLIQGLYLPQIRLLLRRANPEDYQDTRAKLFAIVANERQAISEGYGVQSNYDGLAAVSNSTLYRTPRRDLEEPMEIGKMDLQCFLCKAVGHLKRDCPRARGKKMGAEKSASRGEKRFKGRCYKCQKLGHKKSECRVKQGDQKSAVLNMIDEDQRSMTEEEFLEMAGASLNMMKLKPGFQPGQF